MSPRHLVRVVGWCMGCALLAVTAQTTLGPPWSSLAIAGIAVATGWLLLWLPRTAHAAFDTARFALARRRYRLLAALSFTARRERAAVLSCAGCQLAAGQLAAAEVTLGRIDEGVLDAAERVVWLNNRAWAALQGGQDAGSALRMIEEATALRPDVPGVQHTRARALLAVGRVDEAITVLDAMRTGGELSPYLEAERCRELAAAWDRKGQGDYAQDYRERARLQAG